MGRVKVPMELISDSKKHKMTFLRRKEDLIKKARELSTLCDVDVSLIILSDLQESSAIFPSDPAKFNAMVCGYKIKRVSDPSKIKSYALSHLFTNMKNKIQDELAKAKDVTWKPMVQNLFYTDESLMEAFNTSLRQSEYVNNCYYGPKYVLEPEMMQPQNLDMQRYFMSCCY